MSGNTNREDQYLRELLAGKVLGDLSVDEIQEFGELFTVDHADELQELEQVAAALQLVLAAESKSMLPERLRQQISSAALELLPAASANQAASRGQVQRGDVQRPHRRAKMKLRETFVWIAFAASLLLAVQLWRVSERNVLEPDSARRALLAEAKDGIQVAWSSGKNPFAVPVTGDVVWSNDRQEGYMRFVGMPPNVPTQTQYQLWIIDPLRDAEPIDGGVFDINSEGEVIVPIRAKLKVLQPAAFAITIEQPGGVVVSTQEQLPLIAQLARR